VGTAAEIELKDRRRGEDRKERELRETGGAGDERGR